MDVASGRCRPACLRGLPPAQPRLVAAHVTSCTSIRTSQMDVGTYLPDVLLAVNSDASTRSALVEDAVAWASQHGLVRDTCSVSIPAGSTVAPESRGPRTRSFFSASPVRLQVYGAGLADLPVALVPAPMALLPVPYPEAAFSLAKSAATAFNSLVDRVSRDEA